MLRLTIALTRNHPFGDGNKRTPCVALETFLALNGLALAVTEAEAVVLMLALAGGELSDDLFIAWVRENARTFD